VTPREGSGAASRSFSSGLAAAEAAIEANVDRPFLWYFDTALTGDEVGRLSGAAASALAELGVEPGDRVMLHLQNVPQFVIGLLAIWKLGAVAVPTNPMLRAEELRKLIDDCGPVALIGTDVDHEPVYRAAVADSSVRAVITTSPLDLLGGEVPAPLTGLTRPPAGECLDLLTLIRDAGDDRPPARTWDPDDLAVLIYTSGTTGPSKGALLSHRNLLASSSSFGSLIEVGDGDSILALAPIFHITGLILHVMMSFVAGIPLILFNRFDTAATLELIAARRPTFTIAAITAFNALLEVDDLDQVDFSSMRALYTGGAPVPAATVEAWRSRTGTYVRNAYGLSESAAPCIVVPLDEEAPVDPASGALSIGRPLAGVRVDVLDDEGRSLPPREIGELVIDGPGVVSGYWERPDESAHLLRGGVLHTGDVGFVDEAGWVYLVDRMKDLIIASGYKVWPRDVEDVLHQHPAVREAAVVGREDSYRGETVIAFASLQGGTSATAEELVDFCRERLAAYKRPTEVTLLDELPKTASGKVLRRSLRPVAGGAPAEPAAPSLERELAAAAELAERSNWGRWGDDDQRGALNLVDGEAMRRGASMVRDGRLYRLGQQIRESNVPMMDGRPSPQHFMSFDGGDYAAGFRTSPASGDDRRFAEDTVVIPVHGVTTHLDALCHMWSADTMYNGFRGDAVRSYGATKLGVERFEGLVTRGVMIDLPALAGVDALPADFLVTADHVEAALQRQSMTVEPGDAVLVKTDPERYGGLQPGVGASAGLMLADRGICLLGADNVAVNPHNGFDGFANTALDDPRTKYRYDLHVPFLRNLGIYLLELLDLSALARDEVYEFQFCLAPLMIKGGTGSPVNPIAVC
jgi:long-chain acyl-CoA synthetase